MKHLYGAPLVLLLLAFGLGIDPLGAQSPSVAELTIREDSLRSLAAQSRVKGSADAPITVLEISDFECPFCRQFAEGTLPAVDSAFIETGEVRIVYLNYPLPNHSRAWHAAEAALCAGVQNAFWPMHDLLFSEQEVWSTASVAEPVFEEMARRIGIDLEQFRVCTRNDVVAPIIISDLLQAAGAGIRGTPTFIFNGETSAAGALTFEQFSEALAEVRKE